MTQFEELIRIQAKDYAEKGLVCSDITIQDISQSGNGRWRVQMIGKHFGSPRRLVVYVRQVPGDEGAIEATSGNFIG